MSNSSLIPIKSISVDEKGYYFKRVNKASKNSCELEDFVVFHCNNCGLDYVPMIINGYACPSCGSRNALAKNY